MDISGLHVRRRRRERQSGRGRTETVNSRVCVAFALE